MKNILILAMTLSVSLVSGQQSAVSIIPQPVQIEQAEGFFELKPVSTVMYNNDEARLTAELLIRKLNLPTGFDLKAKQGKKGSLQLNLSNSNVPVIGNEGYLLDVTPESVLITANSEAGLFYGVQTLLQLLPDEIESQSISETKWTVPAVKITDYPRFGWRGLMLDVSRHFFPKEDIKRYLDEMSKFKFNTFHWHLTDDNGWRIEIKSLPRLTEVGAWRVERAGYFGRRADPQEGENATYGGFYTQDDIREIIAYATERHITIVPEIDIPGHSMAAIAAYPELSCTKNPETKVNPGTRFAEWFPDGTFKMYIDNTLNPSDENVYLFLDKVFTEVADLFPNPYIHVGGDECYHGFWENDPGCQALMARENMQKSAELQGYFMKRVEKILEAKGKKLIGWDEILDEGISSNATVMCWRGVSRAEVAVKNGNTAVMTPTAYAYLDYTQGDISIDPPIYAQLRLKKTYSFEPVPKNVDPKYILGGQGNLWTEMVPTLRHAEYMTYPRGWALAETFWSPAERKDWVDFVKRIENQFDRSDLAGRNYSRAMYDVIVKTSVIDGKLWVTLEAEVPDLDIYYSTDDTMPDGYSAKYTGTFELPEGPVTLRTIAYRSGKPVGHLIILDPDELKKRAR